MQATNSSSQGFEQPVAPEPARTRPSRPGFCCGCVVASIILTIIFALLLMMMFSSPKEIIARADRSLRGADSVEQAATQGADSVEKAATQVTAAQMRAVRGVRPTMQIQLSDGDVNAYLKEHRDELDLPSGLQDPKVAFADGYIEASVRTNIAFVPVRMHVEIVPEVEDGQLILHIDEATAGKLGLAGMFRKKISRVINKVMREKLDEADLQLKAITVAPGVLTITATLRPTDERSGR